ncbi:MAG: GNAT family N-acetyltransferase, partial [Propionibacteriales bacterium]|nr:GNAT family N-acetyltransferase [Propionibacteriales bacterium]
MRRVTAVQIDLVDPFDDKRFDAWHAAYLAADTAGRDYPTPWMLAEARESFGRPDSATRREALAAVDDTGQMVGVGIVVLPLLDNTRTAYVEVCVPPRHRRRGTGSAVLSAVLDRARHADRSNAIAEVNYPLGNLDGHPGVCFATAHEFAEASTEIHRVLDLPVPVARLDAMLAETARRPADYRLVSWVDRAPDEWVDAYADLNMLFNSEAPTGDLDLEDERWDVARVREAEEMRLAQGRTTFVTAAVGPDGVLVGHTVLVVPSHDPGTVHQWATLVHRAHRGHRLGLALKLANQRAMQDECPDVRVIHTWNAEVNGPMVAVNEQLGFRPVEQFGEW